MKGVCVYVYPTCTHVCVHVHPTRTHILSFARTHAYTRSLSHKYLSLAARGKFFLAHAAQNFPVCDGLDSCASIRFQRHQCAAVSSVCCNVCCSVVQRVAVSRAHLIRMISLC